MQQWGGVGELENKSCHYWIHAEAYLPGVSYCSQISSWQGAEQVLESPEGRLVCLDVVKEKLAWPSWYSCSELPQGYVHCQVVWSEFCPGRSYNPDVGTHFQIFSSSVLLGFSFNWWAVTSHHLLTWLNTTLMSSIDLTPYMMAVINQALQAKDPFSLQVCSSQTTH